MIKQLAHICLHTRSLEETAAFYCDGLGMEKAFDFERKGRNFGYYLKAGRESFIEVFEGDPGEVGNINHLALEVEKLDALIARLTSRGISVGPKKMGADSTWQAWLEDPNGVRIELQEYTPQSSQKTGNRCLLEE